MGTEERPRHTSQPVMGSPLRRDSWRVRSSLARRRPTFPPVTEKLAKMQYFSFLWPVYVFRHCKGRGGHVHGVPVSLHRGRFWASGGQAFHSRLTLALRAPHTPSAPHHGAEAFPGGLASCGLPILTDTPHADPTGAALGAPLASDPGSALPQHSPSLCCSPRASACWKAERG